jgi:hypothetical protein
MVQTVPTTLKECSNVFMVECVNQVLSIDSDFCLESCLILKCNAE